MTCPKCKDKMKRKNNNLVTWEYVFKLLKLTDVTKKSFYICPSCRTGIIFTYYPKRFFYTI